MSVCAASIPPSAYMAALRLSTVTICGQTFTPDELDAIAATPATRGFHPYCENGQHADCDGCDCPCHTPTPLATDCVDTHNWPDDLTYRELHGIAVQEVEEAAAEEEYWNIKQNRW